MVDIENIKQVVLQAGDLAMMHFRSDMKVYQKKDHSIVTEVDLECEQFLKQELSLLLPGSGFIGEETGVAEGNEYTWVVDPIDGTKNFERGLPYFCISIALVKDGTEIVACVTYAPALQDLFWAQVGMGAWLNGQKLNLQRSRWQEVGILGVTSQRGIAHILPMVEIKKSCKSLWNASIRFRVYGAAALDMAYVAAGMLDVAVFEDLGWWDMAAGILLINEAGGFTGQYDGVQVHQKSKSFVAGNGQICQIILDSLADKK